MIIIVAVVVWSHLEDSDGLLSRAAFFNWVLQFCSKLFR